MNLHGNRVAAALILRCRSTERSSLPQVARQKARLQSAYIEKLDGTFNMN